ncbi:MAG: hypothetical protein IAE82_18605, partial [Opitutaceae bacterium]|nr:hypothetical protein [Opitutaceae bacterium]
EAIDFGWHIPVFTPERWLGWFGDANLAGGSAGLGWTAVAGAAGTGIAYLAWAWRRDRRIAGVALAWLATTITGYALLAGKGVAEGSNELYNAYKVFALLQPLALAALALPLRGAGRWGHAGRAAAVLLAAGLVALHWSGGASVRAALRSPALWVDKPLQSIATIASRPDVTSVNMLLEPMWARLWANSMLLAKRHYFRSETYEGRRATPLRGDWDLRDGLLAIDAGAADTIVLGGGYHLVRRGAAGALQIDLGAGWHAAEGAGAGRWVWSSGREATLRLTNPRSEACRVRLEFGLRGHGPRSASVSQDGGPGQLWASELAAAVVPVAIDPLVLPPRETIIRIRSMEAAFTPPGDGRQLGFALSDLKITMEERPTNHE